MTCISSRKSLLCMAFVVPMLIQTSSHAALLSFAAVRDSTLPQDEYDTANFSYTLSDSRTDNGIASAAISSGNAKAQTMLGVNRVAVDNNVPVDCDPGEGCNRIPNRNSSVGGPFAVGISVWADQFTILGPGGPGVASVSASITGEFGPKPDPSYGGGGAYYLFVATSDQISSLFSKPFEFLVHTYDLDKFSALYLEQNVLKPGYTDPGDSLPPGSLFGGTLTGNISFNYGEPFYIVSVLAGYANDFGVLNAFNSANFGVSAPAGAVISTLSGNIYPAAVVPVPSASIMFATGLVVLSSAIRHRRKQFA